MNSSTIRVLIADDHPVVQGGLEMALTAYSHVQLVKTVGSFQELTESLPVARPDVLIMDLGSMGGSPLAMMEHLKRDFPRLGVVVFSTSVDLVPEMLKAGALGYVAKGELTHYLVSAILAVNIGQRFLSPQAQDYLGRAQENIGPRALSEKQETIVKYLAQGMQTEEVAAQMGLAKHTVLNQITLAKAKIGVDTRAELVDWYRRNILGE